MPCAVWMEVAETLAKPWARVMACADLTVFQSVAIQPVDPVRFPSIGDLTERWGWSAHEVRKVLVDDPAWSDPTLTGNGDRAARWAAIKESRTSRSGSHGSRKDRARIAHGSHEDATVEPIESATKAHGFNTDHARIAITSLNTRVGSQSTDTEHRHREQSAPVPVADLFTAPPPSQPDAEPMDSTDESTTHPPVAAAPLPTDVLAVVAVLAKLNPASAARMPRGTNEGIVKATRKAIKALGLPRLLARLEYVAARQDTDDMRFWRETLARKLAPLLTLDGPWVRGLDEAAAEGLDAPQGAVDARAEAVAAWANMTKRADWERRNHCAPNRPECYGSGLNDRIDLADDGAEHARRFDCYVAAGSHRVWLVHAERDRFRGAWLDAYMRGGQ